MVVSVTLRPSAARLRWVQRLDRSQLPFHPGTYRTHAEPVDLAVTLASLLGINAPTHAVGRVLTEALAQPHHAENAAEPAAK